MSPRAALRLEQLGFTDVYDYVPGKTDWLAAGLPREGVAKKVPFAGDVAEADVPTCQFREPLTEALARMSREREEFCVVLDDGGVVLGLLYGKEAADTGPGASVGDAMRPGPTTIRAHEQLEPLLERMREADVDAVLVTNAEGRLLGLLHREAAARAASAITG